MKKNYTSKKYLLIVMCLTITFLLTSGCSEKKKIGPVSQKDVENKRNESGTVDTVNTIQNAIENNTNERERARHKKIRDTSDLFAKNIEDFQDEKNSADAFIYAITNGHISIGKARFEINDLDYEDQIKVCDIILSLEDISDRDIANIVLDKCIALKELGKFDVLLDISTNYAYKMINSCPYGVNLLMHQAYDGAKNTDMTHEGLYKIIKVAREYGDPRIYKDVDLENFGAASAHVASQLYKMKRYEEVIEIYNDTMSVIDENNSWSKDSLLQVCYKYSVKKLKKEEGGE